MSSQANTKKRRTAASPVGFRSVVARTPNVRVVGEGTSPSLMPAKEQVDSLKPVTIPAGKFKATCLQLLDRSAAGEVITITKRGKIVARLMPPAPEEPKPFVPLYGRMKGKIKILGDIVSPDFDAWKRT